MSPRLPGHNPLFVAGQEAAREEGRRQERSRCKPKLPSSAASAASAEEGWPRRQGGAGREIFFARFQSVLMSTRPPPLKLDERLIGKSKSGNLKLDDNPR